MQQARGKPRVRRHVLGLVFCLLAAAGCLAGLRELPYSTSLILSAAESEASQPPGDAFALGPFLWPLADYREAATLEPFRTAFAPTCGQLDGLEAARCVVDIIKERSPRGEPKQEFVDPSFDPADVLTAHLAGQPGHCMSRSFMTATALLAMGKPARIIQLLPQRFDGHNVIELWDPAHGWLVFDPHYDSSILLGDDFLSAVELSHVTGGLRWRRPHDDAPDPNLFASSTISVPEPWLYTRVGSRVAPWPFRGAFVQFGATQFLFGPAQKLALLFAVVFSASAVVVLVDWLRRSRAA